MENIKETLKLSPENLATEQYKALLKHAFDILAELMNYISNKQWDKAKEMLSDSPAGDGYGLDNSFIDFDFSGDSDGDDILYLIEKLESLDKTANPKTKKS